IAGTVSTIVEHGAADLFDPCCRSSRPVLSQLSPMIVVERFKAAQLMWKFVSECFSDTSYRVIKTRFVSLCYGTSMLTCVRGRLPRSHSSMAPADPRPSTSSNAFTLCVAIDSSVLIRFISFQLQPAFL